MLNPKDALDIAENLGILEALKKRLAWRPRVAAVKLATLLKEITQVFELCDKELSRFLTLSFDEVASLNETKRSLIEFEGAALSVRMSSARQVVSRLDNIYQQYLSPWFARVMSKREAGTVADLFYKMGGDEIESLDLLSEITEIISSEASALLDLVNEGRTAEAKARLASLRQRIRPDRMALSRLIRGLYALETEFIKRSGVV